MNKRDDAIRYFRAGYNCAQSVVLACAGESESLSRVASSFGGGIGRMQSICGAVTGAYICLGLEFGPRTIPTDEEKQKLYARVKAFRAEFIFRNRTDICFELLGEDMNTPEGKARIKEKDLHRTICEKCIIDAIDIIEKMK